MSELKPCPFCGMKASMRLYYGGRFGVECDGCGVRGLVLDDEQDAARMWNTRTERTCHKVREWEDSPHGGGAYVLVCSECDELLAQDGEDVEHDGPNYCPNCGEVIESTDALTVFRMWNFTYASTVTTEGLSHFAHEDDYYLCDRCFENVTDCVEEMKRS